MKLVVNGREIHTDAETLEQLIASYRLNREQVVAEVDGIIVDRNEWSGHKLREEAKIELVHFVGGG